MAAIVIALIVGAVIGLLTGVFQWAIGEITGIQLPTIFTDLTTIAGLDLELINSLIPLAEGVTLGYAILGILVVINVVRWVKSFVPTLAG